MQKPEFNKGNLGRELHQLAYGMLNNPMANLEKVSSITAATTDCPKNREKELCISPDRVSLL